MTFPVPLPSPPLPLSLAICLLLLFSQAPSATAACHDDAPYPDWAHAHWIWQDGGSLTQQGTPLARCRRYSLECCT